MLGHLAGVEPEDVAQDEHGELARRQDLQGGHEGEGDGFGLLVAGLGAGRQGGRTGQERVGVRLEPDGLAEPGRLGWLDPGNVPRLAGRRLAVRSALRHRLVAIRYSQVRSEARPSNPPRPCQAASSVSCTASSASCRDPSIR